jgi:DNA-binding beta-propeller fold protein YncE
MVISSRRHLSSGFRRSLSLRKEAWTMKRNQRWFILPLALLSGLLGVLSAEAQDELFVANIVGDAVTVYSRTASGNTAPLRTLSGGTTGLNDCVGVALDLTNDELVVTNFDTPSVTVYSRTATGNTAPLRTLSGGATGLDRPHGVALDLTNNELVVTNRGAPNSVTVYSRTASGNTAPLWTLSGGATGLSEPAGLAISTTSGPVIAFVTRLYQTVLLREPDAPGLAAHVANIQAFGTVIPTVLAFFHSVEFLNQNLTDDQFLDRLYHTFLNRAPDPGGLQAFKDLLASGCRTRDTLIAALTFSDEFRGLVPPIPVADLRVPFVAELYAWILNRPPDPAFQAWVAQLQRSTALATVLSFLHSPEFQTPRRSTATYVNALYLAFLGRPPDCGGLTSWVAALTQQGDTEAARDQVAGQFAASQEFQGKLDQLFP